MLRRGTVLRCAAAEGVTHFMAGVFPLCAFLHVPGKMSKPMWLSLGTTFLVEPPTAAFDAVTRGMALAAAAHVMVPWAHMDAESRAALKLPEEYRQARYVTGRVYLPDPMGRAQKGAWFPVSLSHVHPTLDVALLTLGTWEAAQNPNAGLAESDRFRTALQERHLLRRFRVSAQPAPASAVLSAVGFRGCGALGTVDSMSQKSVEALPVAERDALVRIMADVEGQQEAATIGIRPHTVTASTAGPPPGTPDHYHIGRVTHGSGFHGMSGAPVVGPVGAWAYGTLRGSSAPVEASSSAPDSSATDAPALTRWVDYAPAQELLRWCACDVGGPLSASAWASVERQHSPPGHGVGDGTAGAVPAQAPTDRPAAFVDPVTDDMLALDADDLALIAKMRAEKAARGQK